MEAIAELSLKDGAGLWLSALLAGGREEAYWTE